MAIEPGRPLKGAASRILRTLLPDVIWLLRYAEKEDGWIRLPPPLARTLGQGTLEKYVEIYDDERRIAVCMLHGLFGKEFARELLEEAHRLSAHEQVNFVVEIESLLDSDGSAFRLPRSEAEIALAQESLAQLPPDEQVRARARGALVLCSLLASFFQYLSVMVHGEKLTALVARASRGDGDSEAFCKAVQIDRNLISYHPAFQRRLSRAQLEGDAKFLDELSYRLRNPIAKGKIRYREL